MIALKLAELAGGDSASLSALLQSRFFVEGVDSAILGELTEKPVPFSVHVLEDGFVVGVILPRSFHLDKKATLVVSFDSLKEALSTVKLAELDEAGDAAKGDSSRRIKPIFFSGAGRKQLEQNSRALAIALERRGIIPSRALAEVVTFVQFSASGTLLPPNVDLLYPYFAILKDTKVKVSKKWEIVPAGAMLEYQYQGKHHLGKPLLESSNLPAVRVRDSSKSTVAALLPIDPESIQLAIQRVEFTKTAPSGKVEWRLVTQFPNTKVPATWTTQEGTPGVTDVLSSAKQVFYGQNGEQISATAQSTASATWELLAERIRDHFYAKKAGSSSPWPSTLDKFLVPEAAAPVVLLEGVTGFATNVLGGLNSPVAVLGGFAYQIKIKGFYFKVSVSGVKAQDIEISYAGGRLSEESVLRQVWDKLLESEAQALGRVDLVEKLRPLTKVIKQSAGFGAKRANLKVRWGALADELNRVSVSKGAGKLQKTAVIRPTFEAVVPYPWILAHASSLLEGSLRRPGSGYLHAASASTLNDLSAIKGGALAAAQVAGTLPDSQGEGLAEALTKGASSAFLAQAKPAKLTLDSSLGELSKLKKGSLLRSEPLPAVGWKDSYLWTTTEKESGETRYLCGNDAFVVQPPLLDEQGGSYTSYAVAKILKGAKVDVAQVSQVMKQHAQEFSPSLLCYSDGSEAGVEGGMLAAQVERVRRFFFQERTKPEINGVALFDPLGEIKADGRYAEMLMSAHQTFLVGQRPKGLAAAADAAVGGALNNAVRDASAACRRVRVALPMRYQQQPPEARVGKFGMIAPNITFWGRRGSEAFSESIRFVDDELAQPSATTFEKEVSATAPDLDQATPAQEQTVHQGRFLLSPVLPVVVDKTGTLRPLLSIKPGELLYDASEQNNFADVQMLRSTIPYPSTLRATSKDAAGFYHVGQMVISPGVLKMESIATRSSEISSVGATIYTRPNVATKTSYAPIKRAAQSWKGDGSDIDPNVRALMVTARLLLELAIRAEQGDVCFVVERARQGGNNPAFEKYAKLLKGGSSVDAWAFIDDNFGSKGSRLVDVVSETRVLSFDASKSELRESLRGIPGSQMLGTIVDLESLRHAAVAFNAVGVYTGQFKTAPTTVTKLSVAHVHSGMIATVIVGGTALQAGVAPKHLVDSRFADPISSFFSPAVGDTVNLRIAVGNVTACTTTQKAQLLDNWIETGAVDKQVFKFAPVAVEPTHANIDVSKVAGILEGAETIQDGWGVVGNSQFYAGGAALAVEILSTWRNKGSFFKATPAEVNLLPSFVPGLLDVEAQLEGSIPQFNLPVAAFDGEMTKIEEWGEELSKVVQRRAYAPGQMHLAVPLGRISLEASKSQEVASVSFELEGVEVRAMVPRLFAKENFFQGELPTTMDVRASGVFGVVPGPRLDSLKKSSHYGVTFAGIYAEAVVEGLVVFRELLPKGGDWKIPVSYLGDGEVTIVSRYVLALVPKSGESVYFLTGPNSSETVAVGDHSNESALTLEKLLTEEGALFVARLEKNNAEGEQVISVGAESSSSLLASDTSSATILSKDKWGNAAKMRVEKGRAQLPAPARELLQVDLPVEHGTVLRYALKLSPQEQVAIAAGGSKSIVVEVEASGKVVDHTITIEVAEMGTLSSAVSELAQPKLSNLGGTSPASKVDGLVRARHDVLDNDTLEGNLDVLRGDLPLTGKDVSLIFEED